MAHHKSPAVRRQPSDLDGVVHPSAVALEIAALARSRGYMVERLSLVGDERVGFARPRHEFNELTIHA